MDGKMMSSGEGRTKKVLLLCLTIGLSSANSGRVGIAALNPRGGDPLSTLAVSRAASLPVPGTDFAARCQAPGVIRCMGFDSPTDITGTWGDPKGILEGDPRSPIVIDPAVRASGSGAMKFTIVSNSHANGAGAFWTNFADDLSEQFGPGQEFYVQWRQRFSPEFINTRYRSDGWKQIIIGEGDRPGFTANSCTDMEVVVQNDSMRGLPQMYHSCGGKDGAYEGLQYWDKALGNVTVQNAVGCLYPDYASPPCVKYKPNQWMTFQVHVKIGTWYKNDRNDHRDSAIQLWVAEEGRPSKLVIDFSPASGHGYDLVNGGNPAAKYGKIWLLPYQSNKDESQRHPTAYTWYDELIISKSRIADPK